MPDADRSPNAVHELISRRVRTRRKAKGWTLDQLASLSGVSRSMLSQIERGEANPTLGVAYKIAQALGISLGELVDTASTQPRIDVIRASDRAYLFREDAEVRIRTLSPLHLEKDVEFYEVVLQPGARLASAPHYAGTREFLTLQRGRVRVVSSQEQRELEPGDSAHYPADVPHALENTGTEEALMFLVVIYTRQ